jgi:hypothetical protein
MDMTKVISLRPDHIVTEICGFKKDGGSYQKLSKTVWSWKWFYKFKLKRFVGMTIYVKTVNKFTRECFYNDFYVAPDADGNLRLW